MLVHFYHYRGFNIDVYTSIDRIARRSLDKSIVAFKVAMNKIADIMESVEDNWIIYEMLMQHRNVLHSQIDLLIKEKKKI